MPGWPAGTRKSWAQRRASRRPRRSHQLLQQPFEENGAGDARHTQSSAWSGGRRARREATNGLIHAALALPAADGARRAAWQSSSMYSGLPPDCRKISWAMNGSAPGSQAAIHPRGRRDRAAAAARAGPPPVDPFPGGVRVASSTGRGSAPAATPAPSGSHRRPTASHRAPAPASAAGRRHQVVQCRDRGPLQPAARRLGRPARPAPGAERRAWAMPPSSAPGRRLVLGRGAGRRRAHRGSAGTAAAAPRRDSPRNSPAGSESARGRPVKQFLDQPRLAHAGCRGHHDRRAPLRARGRVDQRGSSVSRPTNGVRRGAGRHRCEPIAARPSTRYTSSGASRPRTAVVATVPVEESACGPSVSSLTRMSSRSAAMTGAPRCWARCPADRSVRARRRLRRSAPARSECPVQPQAWSPAPCRRSTARPPNAVPAPLRWRAGRPPRPDRDGRRGRAGRRPGSARCGRHDAEHVTRQPPEQLQQRRSPPPPSARRFEEPERSANSRVRWRRCPAVDWPFSLPAGRADSMGRILPLGPAGLRCLAQGF